ncbi:hypothetical protein C8F01DRAFT_768464 [Mycena amicta]|nr:hypothetical protein C8F01DRAFT_768464 [Mycena amicta]
MIIFSCSYVSSRPLPVSHRNLSIGITPSSVPLPSRILPSFLPFVLPHILAVIVTVPSRRFSFRYQLRRSSPSVATATLEPTLPLSASSYPRLRAALTNSSRRLCRAIPPASDPWPQARTDGALPVGRHWHSLPSAAWRRMLCCGLGVLPALRGSRSRLEEDGLKWLPPRRRDVGKSMDPCYGGRCCWGCRAHSLVRSEALDVSGLVTVLVLGRGYPATALSLRVSLARTRSLRFLCASYAQDDKCRAEWNYVGCDWVGGEGG